MIRIEEAKQQAGTVADRRKIVEEAAARRLDEIAAEEAALSLVTMAISAELSTAPAVEARLLAIEAEVSSLSGSVSARQALEAEVQRLRDALARVEAAKSQRDAVAERRRAVEDSYSLRFGSLASEMQAAVLVLGGLNGELSGIANDPMGDVVAMGKVSELQHEHNRLMTMKDARNQHLGALRARVDAYDRKSLALESDRVNLVAAKDQEFVYRELTRAFSRNGIPALILDNALAEIQVEVNAVMEDLTGGRITVEFSTQKELKSGKQAESLEIVVSDELGSRDLGMYSGGECARVALAIRLALAKVISRRAGKRIELLLVDEVTDLDSSGAEMFAKTINTLAREHQIIVISHDENMKNGFQNLLQVVKGRDGSYVEKEAVTA
jgi:exonuclease SbcC